MAYELAKMGICCRREGEGGMRAWLPHTGDDDGAMMMMTTAGLALKRTESSQAAGRVGTLRPGEWNGTMKP